MSWRLSACRPSHARGSPVSDTHCVRFRRNARGMDKIGPHPPPFCARGRGGGITLRLWMTRRVVEAAPPPRAWPSSGGGGPVGSIHCSRVRSGSSFSVPGAETTSGATRSVTWRDRSHPAPWAQPRCAAFCYQPKSNVSGFPAALRLWSVRCCLRRSSTIPTRGSRIAAPSETAPGPGAGPSCLVICFIRAFWYTATRIGKKRERSRPVPSVQLPSGVRLRQRIWATPSMRVLLLRMPCSHKSKRSFRARPSAPSAAVFGFRRVSGAAVPRRPGGHGAGISRSVP